MKKLSKLVRISLALFMTVFSTNIVPAATAFADPVGNNGTVKINDEVASDDPGTGNEPHIDSCTVWVRWYGFDQGLRDSTVTLEAQGPTAASQLVSPVGAQDADFTAPVRVDGNTLSHEKSYTLSFSGVPDAQGYHVKATVYTDGSQGHDTKSKVFWLPGSCGPATITPAFTLAGVCGLNNDTAIIPSSDDYTASAPTWDTVAHKVSVTFTMKNSVNKVFTNGAKTITVTKDEANTETDCSERIANPTITLEGVCGIDNDEVIVSESSDYTAGTPSWNGGVVSVTFTIKDGIDKVFTNGAKTITISAAEKDREACPLTPVKPKVKKIDLCYTDRDMIYLKQKEGIIYKVDGTATTETWIAYKGTPVSITAEAKPGYLLTGYPVGGWTFTDADFTDTQCLTITKSVKTTNDTNNDGKISVGDTVSWTITVTNNSTVRSEAFYVEADDPTAVLENDGYIGVLAAGESKTLTATSTISLLDMTTCKIINTASFSGRRITHRTARQHIDAAPLATGSAAQTYTWECPPLGGGGSTPETPETPTAPEAPATPAAELPHTGAGMNTLILGLVVAVVTYGAVYFAQPRKRYQ